MLERLKLIIVFSSTIIVGYGLVGGLMERVSAGDEAYRDLSVFTTVFSKVQNDYVENPDMQKAMNGALHGMLEALDPFSSFVDFDTYRSLQGRENGGSLGIVLSKRYGYGYVVSVSDHGPAHDNGIRVGDLIESIDGRPIVLMSLWEAQERLRGPIGSEVNLRIVRSRRSDPQDVVLARAAVESAEVLARVVEEDLGYIRIPSLEPGVAEVVAAKLRMLQASGLTGLLIDLRGTASGEILEAVAVSDLLLPVGAKILQVKGRASAVEYASLKQPVLQGLPTVLIVDGGTSGVGEIITAAIADNDLGDVVGERTNGHGSIQERFVLEGGDVLLISTQLLWRPDGSALQEEELRESGIEPDLLSPSRDFVTNFYFENTSGEDVDLNEEFYRSLDLAVEAEQLEDAVQHLKELLNQSEEAKEAA